MQRNQRHLDNGGSNEATPRRSQRQLDTSVAYVAPEDGLGSRSDTLVDEDTKDSPNHSEDVRSGDDAIEDDDNGDGITDNHAVKGRTTARSNSTQSIDVPESNTSARIKGKVSRLVDVALDSCLEYSHTLSIYLCIYDIHCKYSIYYIYVYPCVLSD